MTPVELVRFVENKRQAQQTRNRHRRLAEGLATIAHIPMHETRLVAILGKPDDRSNLDALTRWVGMQLKGVRATDFDPLDYLYARLEQALTRY